MSKSQETPEKDSSSHSGETVCEEASPASTSVSRAGLDVEIAESVLPPPLSSAPVTELEDAPELGLRRTDRLLVICLCTAILILSVVHLVRLSARGTPAITIDRTSPQSIPFVIDPNTANWVEWMQLPEIGETTARRIVEDRAAHGPFRSVEDLQRIKGIGAATTEKIRPFLRIEEPPKQSN